LAHRHTKIYKGFFAYGDTRPSKEKKVCDFSGVYMCNGRNLIRWASNWSNHF